MTEFHLANVVVTEEPSKKAFFIRDLLNLLDQFDLNLD